MFSSASRVGASFTAFTVTVNTWVKVLLRDWPSLIVTVKVSLLMFVHLIKINQELKLMKPAIHTMRLIVANAILMTST